ncbi:hypothetical protein DIPPA_00858 [Diplonema papillatum]|nr:hypothetical protein DIPPA_00858 [Diplonema papillatum]
MDDQLDHLLAISGPKAEAADVIADLGRAVKDYYHAAGFFSENARKLLVLHPDEEVEKVIDAVAEGVSAHLVKWAKPEEGWTRLDAFQTKASRTDKSVNAFLELRKALRLTKAEGRIVRDRANGFTIYVKDGLDSGVLGPLPDLAHAAGIAMKHNGAYVMSDERRNQLRRERQEQVRQQFGVTGVDRLAHRVELVGALRSQGVEMEMGKLRVQPVFGLLPGLIVYVVGRAKRRSGGATL